MLAMQQRSRASYMRLGDKSDGRIGCASINRQVGEVWDSEMNSTALSVCLFCDFVWSISIMAGCTYIVFWMGHSGWWFLLAIFLAACWQCKSYRSPEQIAADKEET